MFGSNSRSTPSPVHVDLVKTAQFEQAFILFRTSPLSSSSFSLYFVFFWFLYFLVRLCVKYGEEAPA